MSGIGERASRADLYLPRKLAANRPKSSFGDAENAPNGPGGRNGVQSGVVSPDRRPLPPVVLPLTVNQGQVACSRSQTRPGGGGETQKICRGLRTFHRIDPTNLARRPLSATQAIADDVLLARIARGDRLAMQVLYGRHHVRVFRFGLRLVRNEQLAEDLISEVFLDVWRQAGKFEGRSAVSTWILAITRFKALSAMRRRQDAELDDETAAAIEDTSDDPEVAVQKKDKGEALRRCLTALSAEHREIVDLVYYHEKSVEEVARIVGIPENTVKTRLFYARKKLAELLKAAGIERGWP